VHDRDAIAEEDMRLAEMPERRDSRDEEEGDQNPAEPARRPPGASGAGSRRRPSRPPRREGEHERGEADPGGEQGKRQERARVDTPEDAARDQTADRLRD